MQDDGRILEVESRWCDARRSLISHDRSIFRSQVMFAFVPARASLHRGYAFMQLQFYRVLMLQTPLRAWRVSKVISAAARVLKPIQLNIRIQLSNSWGKIVICNCLKMWNREWELTPSYGAINQSSFSDTKSRYGLSGHSRVCRCCYSDSRNLIPQPLIPYPQASSWLVTTAERRSKSSLLTLKPHAIHYTERILYSYYRVN